MAGRAVTAVAKTKAASGKTRARRPLYWQYMVEPFVYLSPAVFLIGTVMLIPLIIGISYSFQAIELLNPFNTGWVGLENYRELWSDRKFWIALENTFQWTFWSIFFQFLLGLGLALLLNTQFHGKKLFQALVFLPWAVPTFLSALTWAWLFNPVIGPLPHWLHALGLLSEPYNIMGDPALAMWGPITANIWFGVPFFAITLLAALQSIPSELYEAAEMDGASAWQCFTKITLPFLAPMIAITVMLRTIWIANFADLIYVMTGGGPANSTQIVSSYIFTTAFRRLDFGYASAIAVALLGILLIYAVILLWLRKKLVRIQGAGMAVTRRRPLLTVGKYVALAGYLGFALFPLYWLLKIAVTPDQLIYSEGTRMWPSALTFGNFGKVLFQTDFVAYFGNSLIVSLGTAAITTFIAAGAGYAFSRFEFGGKRLIIAVMLITQMFPLLMIIAPIYKIVASLGMLNSLTSLIVVYTAFNIPFATFLMQSFFDGIPKDLEEAAMMDGCTRFQALRKVIFPLTLPGLGATLGFVFTAAWSELLFALMLISKNEAMTFPVGLLTFVSKFSVDWGQMMAAGVLALIPSCLFFIFIQRYLVQGLTSGAVKGQERAGMARIELENVVKRYGTDEVLRDINLDIGDGEFVVLVGPSGCGKSTLLRMIAGLEPITSGEFRIDGERMNDVRPRDRDIAMVFQSYALYPHMDVARNMGFSMEIRKDPAEARKTRVRQAAETLGLTALTERLPKALSGGQRQRVAMGRAIIRDPRAFLFDEPLSNLDAALRVEMRLEIARLHQRLKATMIYVTHDQVEALTLADRIVVLSGGDIQQVGTPLELYERPANRFVAQFIGSPTMNVVIVEGGNGGVRLGHDVILPLRNRGNTVGAVELGIRPEHIEVVAPDAGDFVAIADVVEHLGSDTNIYANVDGLGPLMVRRHGNIPARSGDRLGLRFQQENVHLFAPDGIALTKNIA